MTLLRLSQAGCVTSEASRPGYITCPPAWKSHIRDAFKHDTADVAVLDAYCKLPESVSLVVEPSLVPHMADSLHSQLLSALEDQESGPTPKTKFLLGQGLKTYVNLSSYSQNIDPSLWDRISPVAAKYARLTIFLEAILNYVSECPEAMDSKVSTVEDFASALITNLAGPSHSLRLMSLKVLRELLIRVAHDESSPINLAIEIEESPLTLQSARTISMQVRKLAMSYPQVAPHKWMADIIPHFCFGLFSKKMSPLWDDAAAALKSICEHPDGEKIVSGIAVQWLHEQGSNLPSGDGTAESETNRYVSPDFQCSNSLKVENACFANFSDSEAPEKSLARHFENDHTFSETLPTSPRPHALRVFNAAPNIAEKHSRQIVPLFLSWATRDEDDENTFNFKQAESSPSDKVQPTWGFKDRLAMLGLLGQFINPIVLYKSSEVYEALFGLMCHGNSDIQRSALNAVFTWKSPRILRYKENLLNILDEKRFREELAVSVNAGREDSGIEEEHRGEVLPVLLRLLYGRMISKAGANSGQAGQTGRRKAILRTLSFLPDRDFGLFIQIAFGPLGQVQVLQGDKVDGLPFSQELASPRRQMGLLKMIETVFETLQRRMYPYAEQSLNVVIYCLVRACRALEKEQATGTDESREGKLLTVLRNIRHSCIRCLDLVFSITPDQDWTPYVGLIFKEAINPRLENFAIETAQGISGFLRLFHTWASAPRSSFYLVRHNSRVLTKVVDVLGVDSARDEVKLFVMDEILVPIIELSNGKDVEERENMTDFAPDEIRVEVLSPYTEHILFHLGRLLRRGPSRQVLVSGVQTLSSLAPCVESSRETSGLVSITTYLLRQPPDRVVPKTKSGLLRILEHFLPLYDAKEDVDLTRQVFEAVCAMFDYFRDDGNREVLSRVLVALAGHDSELQVVAELCSDLNSISRKKLGVDYERRLQAFRKINEELWEQLNAKQWRPLLYNMLYHTKDEEELAIRSSASYGLRRFIEKVNLSADSGDEELESILMNILLPALQNGVRQKSELIRSEFVSALGYFVKLSPTRPSVQDMHVLLVGDDEEASFFNNILHIQQHRRLRALRRLATEAGRGKLHASNISVVFIPLIEHFVFDQADDENAHNLTAEAVTTIGAIAEWVDWNQFRSIFRRYRSYMQSKPELEKSIIRLLGRMSDALTDAVNQMGIAETEHPEDEMTDVEPSTPSKPALSRSIPSTEKVASELTSNFIPALTDFVHYKAETEMSLRLPAAVTTIKLLKLLPEQEMAVRLPAVLLDVCSILKSKAQDSRDTARKTLGEVALILGPVYFGYILKELRNTLARGYQRHVLSFTVHSILVATTDQFQHGDLDYCLGDLATVVMDDIFGETGQEKEAEEYVSSLKEVKSSKSFDSMELLAKNSTVRNLAHLVRPLQTLLYERLSTSSVRKVDELFRRIGVGLTRNPGVESRDVLVFCYEVIKESYQQPTSTESQPADNPGEDRFLVQPRRAKSGENRGNTSSYTYKLARFALDVLRSVLNKYDSLLTPANLAGFLPIIGDALVQAHEEVKTSALRLLSTIIKLPLAELDQNSPVYLTEAVKLIKESPSTNTEGAQAALKLIAAMIRERRTTKLRDGHLAYLLKRLISDIEEPDRQGVTFNFIRAVMSRKFVVPEMYDLVDNVATMMVTNQTRSARDLARGVYIHFLMEYPQAKSRWTKQLSFLVKNLDYKYPEGRQSVMEALHLLLSKTGSELAQEIVGTFFLPLVIVMANDDTPECREMAGVLLGELYNRADGEQMKAMLTPLRSWLGQSDNMLLCSAGLQAMRIYFEAEGTEKAKQARFVTGILPDIMQPIVEDHENENWQALYFSLQLFSRLCKAVPSIALAKDCSVVWTHICECLFYPHAWVKTCAANLIGMWFADLAKTNAASGYGSLPLSGSAGLSLGRDQMAQLLRASVQCLRTPGVGEELAMQTVRNIVFLSRCSAENGLELSRVQSEASEAEDSDEDGEEEDEPTKPNGKLDSSNRSAIRYVFGQISSILRRETLTTRAGALVPKTASMGLLAALCRHLDTEKLRPSLPSILLPLQHLTDPTIPAPRSSDEEFRTAYKDLVSNGHEVLDIIQSKLGPTEYITQMANVQESIKERREGRRVKRRIEAVADPENVGREKKRRNDRKHEKRKEKGWEHRERRRGW